MKYNVFKSFQITAACLARNCGVEVRFEGTMACTDGKIIYLPAYEVKTDRDEMLGFLAHESAHVRFTNFSIQPNSQYEHWLTNIFEDTRIEREIQKIYPGCAVWLTKLVEKLFTSDEAQAEFRKSLTDQKPVAAFTNYVLFTARHINHRLFDDSIKAVRARCDELFPAVFMDEVDRIVAKAALLTSTEDSQALAQELIALLRQLIKDNSSQGEDGFPLDDPNAGQDKQEQNESRASENQSTNSQSSQGKDKDKNQGKADQANADGDQTQDAGANADQGTNETTDPSNLGGNGDEGPSTDGQSAGVGQNAQTAKKPSLKAQDAEKVEEIIQTSLDILQSAEDDLNNTLESNRFPETVEPSQDELNDPTVNCNGSSEAPNESRLNDPNDSKRLYEEALAESVGLRRKLIGLIKTQTRLQTRTCRAGRKLDATKLSRLSTWNTRVFEKSKQKESVDTAIQVLLDSSGSMEHSMEKAIKASMALLQTLNTIKNTNSALSHFPIASKHYGATSREVIRFGESLNTSKLDRFNQIKALGSTPLDEALVQSVVALAQTREPKKVLFVITDGCPDDFDATKVLLEKIERSDIDVYGIGIGNCPRLARLFNRFTCIDRVDDLQRVLCELAKSVALS